jgi:hypothetical protein
MSWSTRQDDSRLSPSEPSRHSHAHLASSARPAPSGTAPSPSAHAPGTGNHALPHRNLPTALGTLIQMIETNQLVWSFRAASRASKIAYRALRSGCGDWPDKRNSECASTLAKYALRGERTRHSQHQSGGSAQLSKHPGSRVSLLNQTISLHNDSASDTPLNPVLGIRSRFEKVAEWACDSGKRTLSCEPMLGPSDQRRGRVRGNMTNSRSFEA